MAKGTAVDWIDGVKVKLNTHELCIHNPDALHQILKMDEGEDLIINILLPVHLFRLSFLFGIADGERKSQLAKSVLINDAIPAITTP